MLAVLVTDCSCVPATGANSGAPVVTMISAGLVLTKMAGAGERAARAGMYLRTSAKFASAGMALKAAGSLSIGANGPVAAGAASQLPLFSRYQVLPSVNTLQLVFTAKESPVLPTGASTGSASNTTRLAG